MSGGLNLVVKLGGDVVTGDECATVARGVAKLHAKGHRIVLVHGGGPQTSALQRQLGQEPRAVGGRRVTDEATLSALQMAVGKVNIDLCAALLAAGVMPIGLHGASSLAIEAERRPPRVINGGPPEPVDLGFVGDITRLNRTLLDLLTSHGHVPVLACIGANRQGQLFNINADVVANRVAVLLGADALVLVTANIPGVMRDLSDPGSRIERLTEAEGQRAIDDGVVSAGMTPKLVEAFGALREGVGRIHILGRLADGDLERAIEAPGTVGTVLVP